MRTPGLAPCTTTLAVGTLYDCPHFFVGHFVFCCQLAERRLNGRGSPRFSQTVHAPFVPVTERINCASAQLAGTASPATPQIESPLRLCCRIKHVGEEGTYIVRISTHSPQ